MLKSDDAEIHGIFVSLQSIYTTSNAITGRYAYMYSWYLYIKDLLTVSKGDPNPNPNHEAKSVYKK